jgi:carbon-monoxide dehydrogenase medium subunit
VKPPSFDYEAPSTLNDAVSLLDANQFDAKLLAGGQSLMPLLNMRLTRPALLIDLARIPGLDSVREESGALRIGAMTRQRAVELSETVRVKLPLLHAGVLHIAHPQNRNQGTIGGSLAHADPAAELPALALALDAEFTTAGPGGSRTVGAREFFVTYLTTCLEPSEILTEVRWPLLPRGTGWSVQELARRHGDFALAGVIATVTLDASGRCSEARLVLFGVGATPLRMSAAEQMLVGQTPDERRFADAGHAAAGAIEEPLSDVHADAEYRRSLAAVMAKRALSEATERARASA